MTDPVSGPVEQETVVVYAIGLCTASVCAPSDMPVEDVAASLNRQHPTGITSQWAPSDDETFRQGGPQPGPCNKHADRTHYLFQC